MMKARNNQPEAMEAGGEGILARVKRLVTGKRIAVAAIGLAATTVPSTALSKPEARLMCDNLRECNASYKFFNNNIVAGAHVPWAQSLKGLFDKAVSDTGLSKKKKDELRSSIAVDESMPTQLGLSGTILMDQKIYQEYLEDYGCKKTKDEVVTSTSYTAAEYTPGCKELIDGLAPKVKAAIEASKAEDAVKAIAKEAYRQATEGLLGDQAIAALNYAALWLPQEEWPTAFGVKDEDKEEIARLRSQLERGEFDGKDGCFYFNTTGDASLRPLRSVTGKIKRNPTSPPTYTIEGSAEGSYTIDQLLGAGPGTHPGGVWLGTGPAAICGTGGGARIVEPEKTLTNRGWMPYARAGWQHIFSENGLTPADELSLSAGIRFQPADFPLGIFAEADGRGLTQGGMDYHLVDTANRAKFGLGGGLDVMPRYEGFSLLLRPKFKALFNGNSIGSDLGGEIGAFWNIGKKGGILGATVSGGYVNYGAPVGIPLPGSEGWVPNHPLKGGTLGLSVQGGF